MENILRTRRMRRTTDKDEPKQEEGKQTNINNTIITTPYKYVNGCTHCNVGSAI
jgi:hypothetical protein